MSTSTELKSELMIHLEGARAIAKKAEADNREFTPAERSEVARHMSEAERVKAALNSPDTQKADKKAGDEELKAIILAMGAGLDPRELHGVTKARAPGPWSKAFDEHLGATYRPYNQKALISPSGSVAVPSFSATVPGVAPDAAILELAQVIPSEQLGGTDGFSYLLETVRAHAADVVAPGHKKPTSIYTVERVDSRVRTIAHLSEPIPRQYLADIALLRQYLDGALREGYRLALEDQLINGSGVGENVLGLLHTPYTFGQAWNTDLLTTTRQAVTTLELASITPSAFVFHPTDWEAFELLQDLAGRFYASPQLPVDRAQRRLWSLPVALTTQLPQGTGILADFQGSTRIWEREAVRIDWSENTYDAYTETTDFEANLIRFRCEGRVGFATLRPAGVVVIDVNAGS